MADFKLAVIDETECIGCTKCIQVCPFDAIVGAHKQLHSVLKTECTGCGLCIAPCPVDCIQMNSIKTPLFDWARARFRRRRRRQRLYAHKVNDQKMELSKEAFAKLPETSAAAKETLLAVIART